MTPDEMRWLTWGAIQHRPRGARRWDEPGTAKAIADHCGSWSLSIATEHVLAHARDPKAETPFVIKGNAPHTEPTKSVRQPAKAGGGECRVHPGEYANSCRACAADRLAGDQSAEPRRDKPPAAVSQRGATACRTALGIPEPSPAPGTVPPEPAVDEPAPVLSPEPQDVQQRAGESDSASQPQLQGAGARNLDAPTPAFLDARRARTDTETALEETA